jgi:hypothetical protein
MKTRTRTPNRSLRRERPVNLVQVRRTPRTLTLTLVGPTAIIAGAGVLHALITLLLR